MLQCAENLFAFRPNQTCATGEEVAPKSGMYIDDVAAISLEAMSNIGKSTYATAQQALESKTKLAIDWLTISLNADLLSLGFVIPQQQPPKAYGAYLDTVAPVSLLPRGMTIQRLPSCSTISALYIQSLQYKGDTSENISIEIRNFQGGVLGSVLDTFTGFANADLGFTVMVDKYYSVDVAIVATPTGSPYDTAQGCGCIQSCHTKGRQTTRHDYLKISGYDGVADTDNTYGITVCATVACYLPAAICKMLPTLYTSLYYRVAGLLLAEFGALSAPTDYTAGYINTNPLKELRKEYDKMASDAQKVAILSMVNNLKKADPYCISCDNPASIKIKSMV
jgi:hypothetical protein